jgi:hypothetical protein
MSGLLISPSRSALGPLRRAFLLALRPGPVLPGIRPALITRARGARRVARGAWSLGRGAWPLARVAWCPSPGPWPAARGTGKGYLCPFCVVRELVLTPAPVFGPGGKARKL